MIAYQLPCTNAEVPKFETTFPKIPRSVSQFCQHADTCTLLRNVGHPVSRHRHTPAHRAPTLHGERAKNRRKIAFLLGLALITSMFVDVKEKKSRSRWINMRLVAERVNLESQEPSLVQSGPVNALFSLPGKQTCTLDFTSTKRYFYAVLLAKSNLKHPKAACQTRRVKQLDGFECRRGSHSVNAEQWPSSGASLVSSRSRGSDDSCGIKMVHEPHLKSPPPKVPLIRSR